VLSVSIKPCVDAKTSNSSSSQQAKMAILHRGPDDANLRYAAKLSTSEWWLESLARFAFESDRLTFNEADSFRCRC